MMPRLRSARTPRFRAWTASLLLAAVALAAALSAAPQLHEWLHSIGDSANHECAATLLRSGSFEHPACDRTEVAPTPQPSVAPFRAQPFARVLALLEFTRLEHAPPSFS